MSAEQLAERACWAGSKAGPNLNFLYISILLAVDSA